MSSSAFSGSWEERLAPSRSASSGLPLAARESARIRSTAGPPNDPSDAITGAASPNRPMATRRTTSRRRAMGRLSPRRIARRRCPIAAAGSPSSSAIDACVRTGASQSGRSTAASSRSFRAPSSVFFSSAVSGSTSVPSLPSRAARMATISFTARETWLIAVSAPNCFSIKAACVATSLASLRSAAMSTSIILTCMSSGSSVRIVSATCRAADSAPCPIRKASH